MALLDSSFSFPHPFQPLRRLARLFDTPFDQRARDISREVSALRALTDDELSARGVARADIIRHVLTVRR